MPTTEARYGWPVPEAADPPNGALQISDLANAISATLQPVENNAAGAVTNAGGITGIRALTQAEYDGIAPSPTVLYVITG